MVGRIFDWFLNFVHRTNQDMKLSNFDLWQDDNILYSYPHIYKKIRTEENYTFNKDHHSNNENNKKDSSLYELIIK